ncbi:glycosyltransferase family 4 protein [Paenibacillus sp. VMFN-D1]|uniref:glycosyltransferase family 4 protein n=1 Tax=Paenibacillus sp. VMFN-D1 TaxID=2135608 RepID=UPI000E224A9F|nr:glycosyltransferase family 4 protein [Paenibacillus sp. VMFN-D1]RED37055.1 glycosyl transferase family 1 [Paenibacillus sp. VMFN-D1]
MSKMLLITSRLPYPNIDGRKNILSQYIHEFKEMDPEGKIINISYVDDPSYLKKKPKIIDFHESIEYPNLIEKLINILLYTIILRKWPLQVSLYYSRKAKTKISKLIDHYEPDYVFFDMIRVAEYFIKGSHTNIMNYDDLLSTRYERQRKWVEYTPSLGNVQNIIPKKIKNMIDNRLFKQFILKIESQLTRKYELNISKRFEHLVFTSPKEAEFFKGVTKHPSCYGIPMKFEVHNRPNKRQYNKNKIVFTGKMNVPHNTSAVLFFCEKIWPKLIKQNPDLVFYVVGSCPTERILDLSKEYKNIVVTGEVDNINEVICDAALLVAPLLFGTGVKTKIIEAMSVGVPVVTNEIGMEGINARTKVDYYHYQNEEELIQAILNLINDERENERLSNNSMLFVLKNFSDASIKEKWVQILA